MRGCPAPTPPPLINIGTNIVSGSCTDGRPDGIDPTTATESNKRRTFVERGC